MLLETLKLAVEALLRHPMRAGLTMLGVIIGVAAVIALVNVGTGAAVRVEGEIARLGANLLTIEVGQTLRAGGGAVGEADPFDMTDVEALRSQARGLRSVTPLSTQQARAVAGSRNTLALAAGVEPEYFRARAWRIASGRLFNGFEVEAKKAVCILGASAREALFPSGDGLAEMIRVGGAPCTVVGVLERRGGAGATASDDDRMVAMPFGAFARRVQGSPDIRSIVIETLPKADGAPLRAQVRSLMRERRGLSPSLPDDFALIDMRQAASAMQATTATMTGLLGAIAAVSLLVGGIGIMNIMLVSVTERTREIGVRLAIGALPGHVMGQFLMEAVMLSLAGGVIGILVGVVAGAMLAPALGLPVVIDPAILLVALSVSVGLGIVFGYAPAQRAARLDPIVALRSA
ncbi:MAG: ABC transporter permease [Hyphomicrobiaceae bacterium]|nr:ABC transporter permease [Hyphomicrobiaceae bacterium]